MRTASHFAGPTSTLWCLYKNLSIARWHGLAGRQQKAIGIIGNRTEHIGPDIVSSRSLHRRIQLGKWPRDIDRHGKDIDGGGAIVAIGVGTPRFKSQA